MPLLLDLFLNPKQERVPPELEEPPWLTVGSLKPVCCSVL